MNGKLTSKEKEKAGTVSCKLRTKSITRDRPLLMVCTTNQGYWGGTLSKTNYSAGKIIVFAAALHVRNS